MEVTTPAVQTIWKSGCASIKKEKVPISLANTCLWNWFIKKNFNGLRMRSTGKSKYKDGAERKRKR